MLMIHISIPLITPVCIDVQGNGTLRDVCDGLFTVVTIPGMKHPQQFRKRLS